MTPEKKEDTCSLVCGTVPKIPLAPVRSSHLPFPFLHASTPPWHGVDDDERCSQGSASVIDLPRHRFVAGAVGRIPHPVRACSRRGCHRSIPWPRRQPRAITHGRGPRSAPACLRADFPRSGTPVAMPLVFRTPRRDRSTLQDPVLIICYTRHDSTPVRTASRESDTPPL